MSTGRIGVRLPSRSQPPASRRRANSSRLRHSACRRAAPSSPSIRSRAARAAAGAAERQAGGKNEGARPIDQHVDDRPLGGDKGAETAEGLAQRPHVQIDLVAGSQNARPYPGRCRRERRCRAHHRPCSRAAYCSFRRTSAGSGARSPSMLKTPSVTISQRPLRRGASAASRASRAAASACG